MDRRISVLILDAHEVARQGVRRILDTDDRFEVVGEAGSRRQAMALLRGTTPDAAIVDWRLPEGGGLALLREATAEEAVESTIVVFSAEQGGAAIQAALQAGAGGYVSKSAPLASLPEAIVRAVAGHVALCTVVQDALADFARQGGERGALSDREREILTLVASGATDTQIANGLMIQRETVKTHLQRARRKLGAPNRAGAAGLALRNGLIE